MAKKTMPTYSEALAELESIVQALQQPDCPIETLQAATKRALELLRYCKRQLFETDASLQQMLSELDQANP